MEVNFIDNRNIKESSLYKDGLHLLDSDKRILTNNFIFSFSNCEYFYAMHLYHRPVVQ